MKVFVSWSKPLSHAVAELLQEWLPDVIQDIETWVSTEDISKGARWNSEINSASNSTGQGIFCVTHVNLHEPWLNFEAGALAKSVGSSLARPLLVDLGPSDVTGPLAQFQATQLFDRGDMWRLFQSLNKACSSPLKEDVLRRSFGRTWDEYIGRAKEIVTTTRDERAPQPPRIEASMVAEVLPGSARLNGG